MSYMKSGSPFLYDDDTGDVVGIKDADGGESMFAFTRTDASGNTVLVGADGDFSFGIGTQTLTVGTNGNYATIQAALDQIEALEALSATPGFTPLTMFANGAVTTWAQDADTFAMSTTATTGASVFITPVPFEKVWFKVAGDTYYYPLEQESGVVTVQSIKTVRRIEASVSTPKAVTWYKQNDYTILLLDAYTSESISVAGNACIHFQGATGQNVLQLKMVLEAGCASGRITFGGCIVSALGSGGFISTSGVNTVCLGFAEAHIASVHDDFIFPSVLLGEIRVERCGVTQQPTGSQGHCISPGGVQGDIIVQDIVWHPASHSAIPNGDWDNCFLVDIDSALASALGARNIIINGVNAFVSDLKDDFKELAIFGSAARAQKGNVYISDCHIIAPDTTTTNFAIAQLYTATGCHLYLEGNSIAAPNNTGAQKLVAVTGTLGGACTAKIGRGNSLINCDTKANMTYTRVASGVSGTATVASGATTSVVTHGLGYLPSVMDIQVTPTLLSNAAKFWITAVGATTFQINVDADPGAGTATFAWRIAE